MDEDELPRMREPPLWLDEDPLRTAAGVGRGPTSRVVERTHMPRSRRADERASQKRNFTKPSGRAWKAALGDVRATSGGGAKWARLCPWSTASLPT